VPDAKFPTSKPAAAKSADAPKKSKSARPADQTFEEVRYLKHLIDGKIPVCVKMCDGELVKGTVEYYDQRFIRLTRVGQPNLFIFKQDIQYLYEQP